MLWYTHMAIGAAAGIMAAPMAGSNTAIAIIVSGAAALLPDIDAPRSAIGKKRPIVSKTINLFFGHRGVMHSLAGCAAVSLLFKAVLPTSACYINRYIIVGYVSHLIADMLTPAGVPLLWPIKKRLRIPFIRTGSFAEKMLFAVIAIFILAKIEQMFAF